MDDPFVIYKEWPIDTIKDALEDFKRQMYSGATSSELRAGMQCFDFLTRRTDLPRLVMIMIGAAMDEAEMRITVMDEVDSMAIDQEEARQALIMSIKIMDMTMKRVMDHARNMSEENLRAAVKRRAEFYG